VTSTSSARADPPVAQRPAILDRVSFVVAGAQKSGTSTLDAHLREHPELCLPARRKELHFFDTDRLFAAEPVDYRPYHAEFDPRPPQRLLGEVTPAYVYWPTAAARIARYNPAMRFIVVLRNPVTRAFSHWNMSRQLGREPLSFVDTMRAEAGRRRTLPLERAKRFTYVERGFYAQQLKRIWRHFPVEQTLVFKSEELLAEPNEVLARIAAFLAIDPFPPVEPKTLHAREYDTAMSDEAKRYLIEVYRDEIRELERLLGWDCSAWLA
jgi:Sulfotransferase domain